MIYVLQLALLFSVGLQLASVTNAGVSYIRWGRTECPPGAHVLYKGYIAGRPWNQNGNGANYLCVADMPEFVRGRSGVQGRSARLMGAELNVFSQFNGLFLTENIPDNTVNFQDMPCVRCYVEEGSDVMMVPGRPDCFNSGYNLEYKGFIVTQETANNGGEYICLDEAPEVRLGGAANNNQVLLFPVEFVCGSLPCGPYIDGMEATCAVCSK